MFWKFGDFSFYWPGSGSGLIKFCGSGSGSGYNQSWSTSLKFSLVIFFISPFVQGIGSFVTLTIGLTVLFDLFIYFYKLCSRFLLLILLSLPLYYQGCVLGYLGELVHDADPDAAGQGRRFNDPPSPPPSPLPYLIIVLPLVLYCEYCLFT